MSVPERCPRAVRKLAARPGRSRGSAQNDLDKEAMPDEEALATLCLVGDPKDQLGCLAITFQMMLLIRMKSVSY